MSAQVNTLMVSGLKVDVLKNDYASAIPYKTVKTPFQQHGFNELVVVIIFCLLAIGISAFLRKKNINKLPFIKDKKIKMIERTRISARSSILLIQYNDRFFLMSQSADSLVLISEVTAEVK